MKHETGRWTRRGFMAAGGAAATVLLTRAGARADAEDAATALKLPTADGVYVQAPLPYDPAALEPHIDAATMALHHGKHHAAYVKGLNAALETQPSLRSRPLPALLADLDSVPEAIRTAVRNHGGGHYNHALFWKLMKPGGGGAPTGRLAEAIARDLGGFEAMRKAFSDAAKGQFGSGWAWLVAGAGGKLMIGSTPNQDNPLMAGAGALRGAPVLALDVWEHAYYLKYQNRRVDYIEAWWNVVDWSFAGRLYEAV